MPAGVVSTKQTFASQLWHLADLVQVTERRRSFRARAYRRAVWSLDDLSPQLDDPVDKLLAVPGIGPGVASLIEHFHYSGRLAELERLRPIYPLDARRMARLPRMTPRRLQTLKTDFGVDHLAQLLEAIKEGKVSAVPGVGAATAHLWQKILSDRPSFSARPIAEAASFAHTLARHLESHLPGIDVTLAGQIARFDDWIDQVELAVPAPDLDATTLFLLESALTKAVNTTAPLGVETPAGIAVTLGARSNRRPRRLMLITEKHLRGDLHLHTTWSPDGRLEPSQLLHQARLRGYSYLAITDHTIGLRLGGLDPNALARQRQELDQLDSTGVWVLQGAELNIDGTGSLDLDDDALGRLDFAIAAVHSFFTLEPDEQTARLLRAIEHPAVRVIAHLTGRRIGFRPPIELDLEHIMRAAAHTGTALEVNGHLDRLDLSVEMVALARESGALFVANSDAHRLGELDNIANAAGVLSRAGVGPEQVINAWSLSEFKAWVEAPKRGV